jgi:hypothetical protein
MKDSPLTKRAEFCGFVPESQGANSDGEAGGAVALDDKRLSLQWLKIVDKPLA